MILLSIIIPFFTLLINRQQLFLYSPKDVHPSRLTVFWFVIKLTGFHNTGTLILRQDFSGSAHH